MSSAFIAQSSPIRAALVTSARVGRLDQRLLRAPLQSDGRVGAAVRATVRACNPIPLAELRAALAALIDAELEALQEALRRAPSKAPALYYAYLARACESERARRVGDARSLSSPATAIPQDAVGASFATLALMLVAFEKQKRVCALIEAIGDALDGEAPTLH